MQDQVENSRNLGTTFKLSPVTLHMIADSDGRQRAGCGPEAHCDVQRVLRKGQAVLRGARPGAGGRRRGEWRGGQDREGPRHHFYLMSNDLLMLHDITSLVVSQIYSATFWRQITAKLRDIT